MKGRTHGLITRIGCLVLAMVMLTTEASAVVQEVYVGGAHSINDLGQSDNSVTMSEIKSDYSAYKQTNWLTEYFHPSMEDPTKVDLGEAASWLIDHGIINRDTEIEMNNIKGHAYKGEDGVPSIEIRKTDLDDVMYNTLHLSDMIMYLYKAIYGPVDARTIGVEMPNIRVDNGVKDTLYQIMKDHDYFNRTTTDGISQTAPAPSAGANGTGGASGATGAGGKGGAGGDSGGSVSQTIVTTVNTATTWRYTPQGDEYESIFGDTNIFISDVDITQSVNSGTGGHGGMGGYGGDGAAPGGNGGGGGGGGGGGSAGVGQNALQYETDYKNIYYVPGTDLFFYRADDCIELYIQAALSKGLISTSGFNYGTTDEFENIFVDSMKQDSTTTSSLHVWSPAAPAFLVNKNFSILNNAVQVRSPRDSVYEGTRFALSGNASNNVLGVNYEVAFNSGKGTLLIHRNDLFDSNTGYFVDERVTRMDLYRYIYKFLGGSEKKLSDLEVDIINYKYGMSLETLGTSDDVYILKYLIAKGILDYTSTYDFQGLNDPIYVGDFLEILYRVANENARLDFSSVQLTDSESQWQAQGYSSRTLALTGFSAPGGLTVTHFSDDHTLDADPNTPMAGPALADADGRLAVYYYDNTGEVIDEQVASAVNLLNEVTVKPEADGSNTVALEDRDFDAFYVVEGDVGEVGQTMIHGLTFSFRGAYVSSKNKDTGTGDKDWAASPFAVNGQDYREFLSNTALAQTTYFESGRGKLPTVSQQNSPDNYIGTIMWYYLEELSGNKSFCEWWTNHAKEFGGKNLSSPRAAMAALKEYSADVLYQTTLGWGELLSSGSGWAVDLRANYSDVPLLDCLYYFCNNVYVVALLQANDDLYKDVIKLIDSYYWSDSTSAWWQKLWNTVSGNRYYGEAFNSMLDCIKYTLKTYVKGDNAPDSISFYVHPNTNAWGGGSIGGGNTNTAYKTAESFSRYGGTNNSYHAFLNTVSYLDRIVLEYTNGGSKERWTLRRESPLIEASQTFGSTRKWTTPSSVWEDADKMNFLVTYEANVATSQVAKTQYNRAVNRGDYTWASGSGTTLEVQTPNSDSLYGGYVSMATLRSLSQYGIQIVQDSECILHNVATDTYAYFPPEGADYDYALVGTQIVEGGPEGPAKKMNGQYWYWFDAVRLLVGLQGECVALNGISGISLPYWSEVMHTKTVPIVSESGFDSVGVEAIRLRLGTHAGANNVPEEYRKYYTGGLAYGDVSGAGGSYYWNNFIAGATANRMINMTSRKISYDSGGVKKFGFVVVFLRPAKLSSTAAITSKMSLEETLNAVAKPPAGTEAAGQWDANKAACNVALNWVYGTDNFEYINTGYLEPEVYIYSESGSTIQLSDVGPVSSSLNNLGIKYLSLNKVSGYVDDPGTGATSKPMTAYLTDGKLDNYSATYYLSSDYKVAVLGDRLFVNQTFANYLYGGNSQTSGIVPYMGATSEGGSAMYYRLVKSVVNPVNFYAGRTFKLTGMSADYLFNDVVMPHFVVTRVDSDGTVTCQYGPIMGIPVKNSGNNKMGVVSLSVLNQVVDRTDTRNGMYSSPGDPAVAKTLMQTPVANAVNHSYVNLWNYLQRAVTKYEGITWNGDIVEFPRLSAFPSNSTRRAVLTGTTGNNLRLYSASSSSKEATAVSWALSNSGTMKLTTLRDNLVAKATVNGNKYIPIANADCVEVYTTVKFSAYDFTVKNGLLMPITTTTVADVFSPSLFTSMNDLIIEKMLYEAQGAVPINKVPQGAIVEVGAGYYIAANSDENNKIFVGYAPLTNFSTDVTSPTIQEAAYSMAGHFIRGGNQYINITSYLTTFAVLSDASSGSTSYANWKDSLKVLSTNKIVNRSSSASRSYAILAKSGGSGEAKTVNITTASTVNHPSSAGGFIYAPVLLQFADVLRAYPVSGTDTSNPTYKICNYADNATSGALNQLPFWSSDVLNASLKDWTSTVATGGFIKFADSVKLMQTFKDEFGAAFRGDLFTLVRFVMFIVLIWLFVMSWVCYGFYYGRLMPIVDAIAHPTGDRTGKGVDLFKVFTLGTISTDSEFKLGRFLQYDLILAILMLVVWKSGNITF